MVEWVTGLFTELYNTRPIADVAVTGYGKPEKQAQMILIICVCKDKHISSYTSANYILQRSTYALFYHCIL